MSMSMIEQGNLVYSESALHAVEDKLTKLRDILLAHARASACADPTSVRDDDKIVINVRHMMTDEQLGFYLTARSLDA